MFCEKCGMKLPDDAKFCEQCGSAVLSLPFKDDNKLQGMSNEKEMHRTSEMDKKQKFRKRRYLSILIIVVTIGVIAGISILAKVLLFPSKDGENIDTENENISNVELPQVEESDFFETYEFELGKAENGETSEYSDMEDDNKVSEQTSPEDNIPKNVNDESSCVSGNESLSSNDSNSVENVIEETPQQSNVDIVTGLDVEAEVKQIREWYYHPTNRETKYVLDKGSDGWNYAREYYFHDGELYFAFIFSGSEEHRLYFKDDIMIRYIDENGQIFDYGNIEDYSWWETQAVNESRQFCQ